MKAKSRGNGQGCAYKRGSTWTAQVVIGFRTPDDPTHKPIPIKRTKAGFTSKKDAIAYCPMLLKVESAKPRCTLEQLYDMWEPWYSQRVGDSTMVCYKSAYLHFASLKGYYIDKITAGTLQDCMDQCDAGKRTHQNMKCVARLLWAYAIDRGLVDKDVTEHLYIGKAESKQRDPITDEELKIIHNAISTEQFAEYVYALCYLGFRPGEFLKLKKTDLHSDGGIRYLVGGSKTKAGKDRIVPIPSAIDDIIDRRMDVKETDLLFPQYCYDRKGKFAGYKQMSDAYFREFIFKPLMSRLGIAEGKVPYCARHTYSDKLKNAGGDSKVKAAIMGHTDYLFTQKRYQSVNIKDVKKVAKGIK